MSEPTTLAGAKLYIGTTAAIDFTSDASAKADFEADDWTEIKKISNIGEFGASANILQYPTLGDVAAAKSKGMRNAGDPAIVVGRLPADPGQMAVRAAEKTKFYNNFKLLLADAADEDQSNTVIYFRALLAGVPMQFGGNEDFTAETYTLGIYPLPLIVESSALAVPANLLLPSISGVAQVGVVLTALEGSWTNTPSSFQYQWQQDNAGWADIGGAINKTYVPVVGSIGNPLRVIVTAINGAGNASANSAPTADIIAA